MDVMNDSAQLVSRAQKGINSLMLHNHAIPLVMFLVLKHDENRVSMSKV